MVKEYFESVERVCDLTFCSFSQVIPELAHEIGRNKDKSAIVVHHSGCNTEFEFGNSLKKCSVKPKI